MTNFKFVNVCVLVGDGLAKFQQAIGEYQATKNLVVLRETLISIIENSEYAKSTNLDFEFQNWPNRLHLAEDLHAIFGYGKQGRKYVADRNIWAGLSAQYLIWLLNSGAEFLVGDSSRWIPVSSSLRRHRHLLQGAFVAYEENIDDVEGAMAILASDPLKPGEVVERVAGKASYTRGSAVKLATKLYYDKETGLLKEGSSSHGPGSVRRLSYFLSQIDLTLDYSGMTVDELESILPDEFKKWLVLQTI
jgi:hypothetical protein